MVSQDIMGPALRKARLAADGAPVRFIVEPGWIAVEVQGERRGRTKWLSLGSGETLSIALGSAPNSLRFWRAEGYSIGGRT